MTKRAGKTFEGQAEQWFIEPAWMVEQIFDALDFGSGGWIWDPSCGNGTILDVARSRGFYTVGGDIVDRPGRAKIHAFQLGDFTRKRDLPFIGLVPDDVSIICNPPYGTVRGVAKMGERFVRHAREHFADKVFRMAFIVPVEFACGQGRFELYERDRPSHILLASQRPSMLPGELVEAGQKPGGGMADYCVIVWTRGGPYRCETRWLRPSASIAPVERRKR